MAFFTVSGPDGPYSQERLWTALSGTKFRVINTLQQPIIYDNTPLANLMKRHDDWHEISKELSGRKLSTIADVQQLGAVEAWKVMSPVGVPSAATLPLFTSLCIIMGDRELQFVDGIRAEKLTLDANAWSRHYGASGRVANLLVSNGLGGPALLIRLEDYDIKRLWHCGPKLASKIIAFREELCQRFS